jgi:hypothetical protein
MKAAGLVVDWSSALRANTVPDQCALRSFPYPNNLSPTGKIRVHTVAGSQNRAVRLQFLASHLTKSVCLGLQLATRILSKHIA